MDRLIDKFEQQKELKFGKMITYIITILFVLVIIGSFLEEPSLNIVISLAGILLLFILNWISNRYNNYFANIIVFISNIFIFLSLYLGSIRRFYGRFPGWDNIVHFISGIILSIVAFGIIFMLNKDIDFHDNKIIVLAVIFSICFSMAMGVFWEIYEYAASLLPGINMQSGGLIDTMEDLIADTLGAILASIASSVYIKKSISKKK